MKTRSVAFVAAVTMLAPIFSLLSTLPAAAVDIGVLAGAGPRPNATRLSFTTGDSVQANVDVGTGNLYVTVRSIQLPGVSEPVQMGAFYNSAAAGESVVKRPRFSAALIRVAALG